MWSNHASCHLQWSACHCKACLTTGARRQQQTATGCCKGCGREGSQGQGSCGCAAPGGFPASSHSGPQPEGGHSDTGQQQSERRAYPCTGRLLLCYCRHSILPFACCQHATAVANTLGCAASAATCCSCSTGCTAVIGFAMAATTPGSHDAQNSSNPFNLITYDEMDEQRAAGRLCCSSALAACRSACALCVSPLGLPRCPTCMSPRQRVPAGTERRRV